MADIHNECVIRYLMTDCKCKYVQCLRYLNAKFPNLFAMGLRGET
jgi:hypothetical protein